MAKKQIKNNNLTIRQILGKIKQKNIMDAIKLRERINKQVDLLNENELLEFYGVIINFLNKKTDINEWNNLPEIEKQGIFDAIAEIDEGKGIDHNDVVRKYKIKYSYD